MVHRREKITYGPRRVVFLSNFTGSGGSFLPFSPFLIKWHIYIIMKQSYTYHLAF